MHRHRSAPPDQLSLCCPCGSLEIRAMGRCETCYRRRRLSRKNFAGGRERAIERDEGSCQGCASTVKLIVHHRSLTVFVTLCRGCHLKIHRTKRPRLTMRFTKKCRRGLTPFLFTLWLEVQASQGAPPLNEQMPLDLLGVPEPPREQIPLFGEQLAA